MKQFRYTVLLESGNALIDIAQFRSIAEAELFLAAVSREYLQYHFSLDDTYRNLTLEEIVEEETELQEM